MHLTSVLFMQCKHPGNMRKDELDLFIINEGAKKDKMIKKMCTGYMHFMDKHDPVLNGSCNGLLLFKPSFHGAFYSVCNPVTRQHITIRSPTTGIICGFFYHPLTKEFSLLLVRRTSICFEYFIYSLGDKLWTKLADFPYRPSSFVAPAILNGVLHWMVERKCDSNTVIPPCSKSIMMFNMDTSDFRSMPHPGKESYSRRIHGKMHLLEMKGQLSFCYLYDRIIYIWILEDYENSFWVEKNKVNLDWDVKRYPFVLSEICPNYFDSDITLLSIQNDDSLLDWYSRGLFRYHLGQNTVKKIDLAGTKMPVGLLYNSCVTIAYVKSFVWPRGLQ